MSLVREGVEVLGPDDLVEFDRLAREDREVNVFAIHRGEVTRLNPRWLGGEVWGRFTDGRLTSACHLGANVVPIHASPDDAEAFGERAAGRARTSSTIVGPQEAVRAFWSRVEPSWGSPREQRWNQPHMVIRDAPAVKADPHVRRTLREDMPLLYPACVAMYTEEVGVSPEAGGNSDLYRARVRQLSAKGWSFARFEDGQLIFKAEVACSAADVAQIQGVWVPPERRGEGIAVAGMAAVVKLVRATIAPVVSLYVNEWNTPARRAYEAVGFVETERFATIMY